MSYTYKKYEDNQSTRDKDNARNAVASNKPTQYTYDKYVQSDAVKNAYANVDALNAPGVFKYSGQKQMDKVFDDIMNREDFSYDMNADALYQQYKNQYESGGKLAMQDTMGKAAAMTGGYGNSYTQQVGQQTYNSYMQQLNDKIPELYQLALDQYNREGQEMKDQYAMHSDRYANEYGQHRDNVADYNNDRAYYTDVARYLDEQDYSRWADDVSRGYGMYRDSVNDWYADMNRADNEYWNERNFNYADHTNDQEFSYRNSSGGTATPKTVNAGSEEEASIKEAFAGAKNINQLGDTIIGYAAMGYDESMLKSMAETAASRLTQNAGGGISITNWLKGLFSKK